MDAFVELDTWKNCQQLSDYTDLAVVARFGQSLDLIDKGINRLGRYSFDSNRSCWVAPDRLGLIYPVNMPPIAISSTDVRQRAMSGASLDGLVPPAVSEYLVKHDLFVGS